MAEKSTGLAALLLIGIVIAAVLGLGLLKLSAPRDITILALFAGRVLLPL